MNTKNIFRICMTAAVGFAGLTLAGCDDDKDVITDYKEAVIPKEISFPAGDNLPLGVGMDSVLVYKVNPVELAGCEVAFFSNNESVATVDATGKVHAVDVGSAVITCTMPIGFGPTATLTVNVLPEVILAEEVKVTNTTGTDDEGRIYVTDELQMAAEILPANHTYSRIDWFTSDPSVATIDENGLLKCLAPGDVTVIAVAADRSGVKGTLDLHIDQYISVEEVTIAESSITTSIISAPTTLTVTYMPQGATVGSVIWSTSDENVATVHRGVVTPTGFGTCYITASCPSTGKSATVEVKVPAGWYVWDASNQWKGHGNYDTWVPWRNGKVGTDEIRGEEYWRVNVYDDKGKWRQDIRLNCSNDAKFTMFSQYPVMVFKTTLPKGGVFKSDIRDVKEQNNKDGYDLSDGTRLMWVDLTDNFSTFGASHDFNLYQIKCADIPKGKLDENAAYYDIYWIRTFKSLDEAKKFAEDEIANKK